MPWNPKLRVLHRTDVRLTLWYTGVLLAALAAACSFLAYRLHRDLLKQVDGILKDEVQEVYGFVSKNATLNGIEDLFRVELEGQRHRIHANLLDLQGRLLVSSGGNQRFLPTVDPDIMDKIRSGQPSFSTFQVGKVRFRQIITLLHSPQGSWLLQMAMDLKEMRNTMGNFARNVAILIPASLLVCALGGWLLARRSLSPIHRIVQTTERVSAQNLRERLPSDQTGDDLDDLVQTINRMLDRLESSFEEIRKFSADASHELRTPLCAMRGEAEVLLSRERSASEYREALEGFMEQFDRLSYLTNDLLLLARFEAQIRPSTPEMVDIGALLEDLVGFFDVLAQERGIHLVLRNHAHATVEGERLRLQQAFSNLLDNALQYTADGGTVDVEAKVTAERIQVRVTDTGAGIPAADLPHVFDRFYRVDKSRSRQTGGSGLGLSITRKIVEMHGGSISIQSDLGHGTSVEVVLPLNSCNTSSRPK